MSLLLGFCSAIAALIIVVVRNRWSSGPMTDARSEVTKLVISADRRRQRRQTMAQVIRNGEVNSG